MKTRWGSFSPQGRITLNLWLITMPVDCLDYVIMHELCHCKISGHGPRFWKLLERFLPDCRSDGKNSTPAPRGPECHSSAGVSYPFVGVGAG